MKRKGLEKCREAVSIEYRSETDRQYIRLSGHWTVDRLSDLERQWAQLALDPRRPLILDSRGIENLDLSGGWLILRLAREARQRGYRIDLEADPRLDLLNGLSPDLSQCPPPEAIPLWRLPFIALGRWSSNQIKDLYDLVTFLGRILSALAQGLFRPHRLHLGAISQQIYQTGIQAVPIVGLIAFLISVVLAYQGAYQLRMFGADIFTIDLVAVSLLREMGVLLTAIMVAGRSGSAFAAQLGVMKINEEIDAMRAIGLDPFATLILPRIIGLVIALPLLTVLANLFGLGGAVLLSRLLLDIPFEQFLIRLEQAIDLSTWWVGIAKAPIFAFLIALVGTLRGMQVSGSAEHLGRLTTVAVVQSIFLVIVADALFSVVLSELGI